MQELGKFLWKIKNVGFTHGVIRTELTLGGWRKDMKVFALGGYGAVGLTVAELLAESDLVSEIALAGRSKECVEQTAKYFGDKASTNQRWLV